MSQRGREKRKLAYPLTPDNWFIVVYRFARKHTYVVCKKPVAQNMQVTFDHRVTAAYKWMSFSTAATLFEDRVWPNTNNTNEGGTYNCFYGAEYMYGRILVTTAPVLAAFSWALMVANQPNALSCNEQRQEDIMPRICCSHLE